MQKLMKKVWRRKKGFTLVELLIVVAIIGVLAGIAIPNFLGARTRARVAKSFADMDAIAKAQEMYFVDNLEYADSTSDLAPGYVSATVMTDPWNRAYRIATSPSDTPTLYVILGDGPDQTFNIATGDITWTNRARGALGGSEGPKTAYGVSWYDPGQGVTSSGDIGYGSG